MSAPTDTRRGGPTEPPPPSPRALELLGEAGEAFTALRAAHARVLDAVHQLDVENTADEVGYLSLSRLLQDHVHADASEITELRRHARLLHTDTTPTGATTPPPLPAASEAIGDAAIGPRHVRVIEQAMKRLSPLPHLDADTLNVAEEQLADLARERTPAALVEAAAAICDKYDPDGAAPAETSEPVDELHLQLRRHGSRLDGKFRFTDPEAIETVLTGLRLATPPPGPRDDEPADLDHPGDAPPGRPIEQRQAQGLRDLAAEALTRPFTHGDENDRDRPCADDDLDVGVELDPDALDAEISDLFQSEQAGTATAPGSDDESEPESAAPDRDRNGERPRRAAREGGETPHVAVTIDWELLKAGLRSTGPHGGPVLPGLGRLGSGVAIGPETARRLACDAQIIPMVLGTRSEPLDIGRKSRIIPPGIRRAVVARDRHCAFPGCRRHARKCEAHHVVHWAFGGETEINNLTLLCSFHHTLVHHSGWSVDMIDGLPWFVPPRWISPDRRPLHNRPWHADLAPADAG